MLLSCACALRRCIGVECANPSLAPVAVQVAGGVITIEERPDRVKGRKTSKDYGSVNGDLEDGRPARKSF